MAKEALDAVDDHDKIEALLSRFFPNIRSFSQNQHQVYALRLIEPIGCFVTIDSRGCGITFEQGREILLSENGLDKKEVFG